MSMLSAQCDELREMAGQLQEHGTFAGYGGTTSTDPLMHGVAIVMREAADTIWELRCKLSDMVDERERARVAEAENAKLRELLQDAVQTLGPPALRVDEIECGTIYEAHISRLEQRMRELGVEV